MAAQYSKHLILELKKISTPALKLLESETRSCRTTREPHSVGACQTNKIPNAVHVLLWVMVPSTFMTCMRVGWT